MTPLERWKLWQHDEYMRNTHPRDLPKMTQSTKRRKFKKITCKCGKKIRAFAHDKLCEICFIVEKKRKKIDAANAKLQQLLPVKTYVSVRHKYVCYFQEWRDVLGSDYVKFMELHKYTRNQAEFVVKQGKRWEHVFAILAPRPS